MASNCTHRTHHRCVFGVIMHTPPRTCPPITIGPAARSFHPIRAPLFEAPQATLIHRHSKTRPDRAGDTPTHDIRTVPTHMHACTAHTSAHTHHHEHKQTHTPTHRHAHTHKHTKTPKYRHTHAHPYTPIKSDLLSSRCPVLTTGPRLRVYTLGVIPTREVIGGDSVVQPILSCPPRLRNEVGYRT